MGFQLAEAFVDIKANDAPFNATLAKNHQQTVEHVGRLEKTFEGLAGTLETLGILVGGLEIGKKIFEETSKGQTSIIGLKAALRAFGLEVDDNFEKMDKLAGAMSESLGIQDDYARDLMTMSVNMGHSAEEAENMSKAAIGLAKVMGTDAKSAMETLNKAQEGNFRMLERSIPKLKELDTAEEKLAEVRRRAQAGLRETEELSHSLGGETERMKIAVGELAESIGTALAPALEKGARGMTTFIKTFTTGTEEFMNFELGLQNLIQMLTQFVGDDVATKQAQVQIDQLNKALDKIEAARKKATDAEKGDVIEQLKLLGELKEKTQNTFSKIEDVWKHAQEEAIKDTAAHKKNANEQNKIDDDKNKHADDNQKKANAPGAGGSKPRTPSATDPDIQKAAQDKVKAEEDAHKKARDADKGHTHLEDRDFHKARIPKLEGWFSGLYDADRKSGENAGGGDMIGKAPKSFIDKMYKNEADLRKSQDIAEFGSTGKAELERKKANMTAGVEAKIKADRAGINGRYDEEQGGLDSAFSSPLLKQDPGYKARSEQIKRNREADLEDYNGYDAPKQRAKAKAERDRMDAGYAPAIKKEEKDINTPINDTLTGLKEILQKSLTGTSDGKPILTQSKSEDKMLEVLGNLATALPNMSGFTD